MGHQWCPISVRLLTSVPVGQKLWMCLPNRKIMARWTTISNSLLHSQLTSSPMAMKLIIAASMILSLFTFQPTGAEAMRSSHKNSVPLGQNYYPPQLLALWVRSYRRQQQKMCNSVAHFLFVLRCNKLPSKRLRNFVSTGGKVTSMPEKKQIYSARHPILLSFRPTYCTFMLIYFIYAAAITYCIFVRVILKGCKFADIIMLINIPKELPA